MVEQSADDLLDHLDRLAFGVDYLGEPAPPRAVEVHLGLAKVGQSRVGQSVHELGHVDFAGFEPGSQFVQLFSVHACHGNRHLTRRVVRVSLKGTRKQQNPLGKKLRPMPHARDSPFGPRATKEVLGVLAAGHIAQRVVRAE